ncbi:Zinc finger C2H2-type [Trinorchestia longiramus]|nr:Zinc finger C2H2-type [Trinorchestia longiramus]
MPSNKMSGYKNRNRTRDRHWREPKQDGLLGSAPRGMHGRQQPGLLGGGPHNPAMAPAHRPNPWESGMMPGNRALPHPLPRNQGMWGGNAPQPPSLLGTPHIMGGGSGAGLLGGGPRDSTIMGINQLARMNSRDTKMALNIIDTVLGPQHGGPGHRYNQFPYKMGHMDRSKMARGSGHASSRSGGGGGGSGSSSDLRKWLKDKRSTPDPRSASRHFASTSSSHHRSGSSSSASSSRKDRPESSRGTSPPKTVDDKDAEAEEKCPVEALHCHVCNIDQFSSLSSFKQHLRSSPHEEMLSALYRKNSAVLDLLRQQSKIAAMQQTLAATVDDKEPKKSQCYKCFCKVPGSLQRHIASVEHKLVNNFQIVKCCNVWYSSRPDYEQHKLSFRHLLTKYEEKQQKLLKEEKTLENSEEQEEEDGGSSKVAGEWWSPTDRALKNLRQASQSSEPLTSASLSPYTGLRPVGESFVQCRALLECSVCDERFDSSAADLHCRSNTHYLHVLNALKAQDEMEAAAAQPAPEKLNADELAQSREDDLQNQSSPSNSCTVKPERTNTSDDDAKEEQNDHDLGYRVKREDERSQVSDGEQFLGRQHDDPDDDEDERMIYEGLHDEPQLEFDDDEEELHDEDDASKANDEKITSEELESSRVDDAEKSSTVAGEDVNDTPHLYEGKDKENVDQFEHELIENETEKRHEQQESTNTDPKSAEDKDAEPASERVVNLEENASVLPPPADNIPENDKNLSINECETKHEELEDVKHKESEEVQSDDAPEDPPRTTSEAEREEEQPADAQATRRSGRASRKRPAADDAAEPVAKRGRGRGRGRGGRK